MLWEVEIRPAAGEVDREGQHVLAGGRAVGAESVRAVSAGRSYLIEGNLDAAAVQRAAVPLLADAVTETATIHALPSNGKTPAAPGSALLNVLFKPGVTDNVGLTAAKALQDVGLSVERVATCRKYWVNADAADADLARLAEKVLANDAIEHVIRGPLQLKTIGLGSEYKFKLQHVAIRGMNDDALKRLSKEGQLYLSLREMQTIRDHFVKLDRDPTDIELETVAQTWSEHCSHKTLAGRIAYRDPERGEVRFENMLKETVFAATQKIRKSLGKDDWCISVFKDNAGVVTFNDEFDVCIKVETHNHPSALEPYGGANTGLGGVIRDPLGTGLGAKPVCNTDVFCFAPPDTPYESLPPGVLHPKTVMRGVVSGVRDYGNRMGIPTVNGAVYFDERYLGNPLVYCGNVALIPRGKSQKHVEPGDYIVAVGGRTGRDGIHGATFSSAELTHESEELSGGAVQIGNAITEKMLMDVVLAARDRELYHAITDCGAGGFSSAVGEMGEETGAEVWLDQAPLKYSGLSYTEIWISEAQERMVLAVPPKHWEEFRALCASEGVEASILGQFTDHQQLVLKYHGEQVGELSMEFLHNGRPPVVREAVWEPRSEDSGARSQESGSATATADSVELAPLGRVTSAQLAKSRNVRVVKESIDEVEIDPNAASYCPELLARDTNVVPLRRIGDQWLIAVTDTNDHQLIDRLRFVLNHDVCLLQATPEQIRRTISRVYGVSEGPADTSSSRPTRYPLSTNHPQVLHKILGSLNVCSKEWIIRQYDHEVQAGSVVKPLVGVKHDGPSDAAVVQPDLTSRRGLVIACGMNPRYGDFDPYWMAAAAIDEAVRNCIAVGADPERIAILDNFCWGNTERPETLGSLVRAALGCHDTAIAFGTPFVSGKDSLNNEFTYEASGVGGQGAGGTRTISVPPSLLITALGQVEEIGQCVTMDLKDAGNVLYQVGATKGWFGGTHYDLVTGQSHDGHAFVDMASARLIFADVHRAIRAGLVRSCHDLSEGGLAVALAEMAFSGGLGVDVSLAGFGKLDDDVALFSETPSRFVIEVEPGDVAAFEQTIPYAVRLGTVAATGRVAIKSLEGRTLIEEPIAGLKTTWQRPLAWE
jgi:phosphoribosylformylglycinamidine (FGAM) synthase-like enzyme/phosphoribosylformylglycinamidine (FGAM) synthase PurS component